MFYKERPRVHLELKKTMHIPISVFSLVLHYNFEELQPLPLMELSFNTLPR